MGGRALSSLPQPSPPLSVAALCKGDDRRRRAGHCRGPQKRQGESPRGRESLGSAPAARHSAESGPAAAPRGPPRPSPRCPLRTLTPSPLGDWEAGGSAWHPPSFQSSQSSTGRAHSILEATAPGTPRLGRPAGPCHRWSWGGCSRGFPPPLPAGRHCWAPSRLRARTLPDCVRSLS